MEDQDDPLARLREMSAALVDPELALQWFEQAPDATVVVDMTSGEIVAVNRQAELIFGYHRSEMVGKRIAMLIPDHLRDVHAKHRQDYATDPRFRPMGIGLDLKARHKSGAEVAVEINLSPAVTTHGTFTIATVRRKRA